MKYTIKILPSGVSYKSENNLLDDALAQSVPLEHSCKTGDCGMCSASVISGSIENENGDLINSGSILTCQSKALSDITLQANYYPELVHIKQQTLPCKVGSFEWVTSDIVVIKFRFPPTATFDYLPGQYVDLSFKGIKRSYSIANAKPENKELELHIRKVPSGKMSQFLVDELKVNQLMRLEGPKGTFFIRKDTKPLILLAGGTGIAPVKAIVEDLVIKKDPREIFVYWGMSSRKDFYLPEMVLFAEEMEGHFHFIPVCSGEKFDAWDGRRGFVHQAVCEDFDSLDGYQVYACGAPVMIDAAKKDFSEKGLPSDAFFSDAFTPAK